MKLPYAEPHAAGTERADEAKRTRDLATEIARLRPQALTRSNGEETDHGPVYPAAFTKGLKHDKCGLLECPEDYRGFVEAINSPDRNLFDSRVVCAPDRVAMMKPRELDEHDGKLLAKPDPRKVREHLFRCRVKDHDDKRPPEWRGWESPRAGLAFDLQGPDAGAVGMAPAPRVGSSELAAEMAEVYALAILRDTPFGVIEAGGGEVLCPSVEKPEDAVLTAAQVTALLGDMPFYDGTGVTTSTPGHADASGLNRFERNRRLARTGTLTGGLTTNNLFRGSTEGARAGHTISQFMLIGAGSLAGPGDGVPGYPGLDAAFDPSDGYIPYGAQIVDQRGLTHKNCLDHMTDWASWLDVQNGANLKGGDAWEPTRRFITTPRDLATYVHFDALYQAYLNAALILMGLGSPFSKGFPEPSPTGKRDAFATFGGPHVLSLVTEVATRCLKAVRRQKFNYHRRARPEALGGRLTLAAAGLGGKLGCAGEAFKRTLDEIPEELREAVKEHNARQNTDAMRTMRPWKCPEGFGPDGVAANNLLLPMAFPEGSPMHPAYGAGHATVAGGCVTVLKAFFEMFEDCDGGRKRILRLSPKPDGTPGDPINFVPTADGSALAASPTGEALTVQGELDKLAANIAIGRNMAGVHYYSDYYDSLRMGERVAIGMMMEQAPGYGDAIEKRFHSFDGDLIEISGEGGSCPSLSIIDRNGTPVGQRGWWLRHVPGEEPILDF